MLFVIRLVRNQEAKKSKFIILFSCIYSIGTGRLLLPEHTEIVVDFTGYK